MAAKGVKITQFDMDGIERLGLVKIDLLGIRGLKVVGDVAETIYLGDGKSKYLDTPLEVLDTIPDDDPMTIDAAQWTHNWLLSDERHEPLSRSAGG
jgi:DNA polymerase III alpha subunit